MKLPNQPTNVQSLFDIHKNYKGKIHGQNHVNKLQCLNSSLNDIFKTNTKLNDKIEKLISKINRRNEADNIERAGKFTDGVSAKSKNEIISGIADFQKLLKKMAAKITLIETNTFNTPTTNKQLNSAKETFNEVNRKNKDDLESYEFALHQFFNDESNTFAPYRHLNSREIQKTLFDAHGKKSFFDEAENGKVTSSAQRALFEGDKNKKLYDANGYQVKLNASYDYDVTRAKKDSFDIDPLSDDPRYKSLKYQFLDIQRVLISRALFASKSAEAKKLHVEDLKNRKFELEPFYVRPNKEKEGTFEFNGFFLQDYVSKNLEALQARRRIPLVNSVTNSPVDNESLQKQIMAEANKHLTTLNVPKR